MALCIAVLDRNSTPLNLSTTDPSKEVAFHYIGKLFMNYFGLFFT